MKPLAILSGRLDEVSATDMKRLIERGGASGDGVRDEVRAIIADVRVRGDAALREMALRFDGVSLGTLEVSAAECRRARDRVPTDVRSALEEAAAAIGAFHGAQMPADMEIEVTPGVRLGRRSEALDSVGVYAPGGRAAYPSSVLMGVVPARVAGVREVAVCSPPGPDGRPSELVLAACAIAGADRVYAAGGAGAIAALAYGTKSVTRVVKIVGPGNAYVAEAKLQLSHIVGIDSPAGPSEVLIIADAETDPDLVAVELIAQAEHDPDAAVVAIMVGTPALGSRVLASLERMIPQQTRREIIVKALADRGAVLTAMSVVEAVAFARTYAPEHLALMIENARDVLPLVRCAGTVFLGSSSSVAFGDYMTGANHVLPTGALARSFSGLATADFMRQTTYQEVDSDAAAVMAGPARVLAEAEGLHAHALAATMRAAAVSVAPRNKRPKRREQLRDIELYDPGRAPCAIDLSDNTNLAGVPPHARAVLEAANATKVTRYPSVYATDLRRVLAARHDVDTAQVSTGCGSDDVLDSIFRAFCEPGDAVAFPSPTFGVVPLFARMNAAKPMPVPHAAGLELDVPALVRMRAAVTYICRPNNPTGTLYSRASVARLAEELSGVLVIDEAYADYAGDDVADLASTSERTIIVRTMSKAYGLAGLRIGYALGCGTLIAEVEKARGPYKVGGLAEAAAVAALTEDAAWVREQVQDVCASRARLAGELTGAGLGPLPSDGNFLLVPLPAPLTAETIARAMREQGVAVRPFADLPGIGDAIRITVGPWPMMERLIAVLASVTEHRLCSMEEVV